MIHVIIGLALFWMLYLTSAQAQVDDCPRRSVNMLNIRPYDVIIQGVASVNKRDALLAAMSKKKPLGVKVMKAWKGAEKGESLNIWFSDHRMLKSGEPAIIYARKVKQNLIVERCDYFSQPGGNATEASILNSILRDKSISKPTQ